MDFLNIDINDAVEPRLVDDGSTHELRIIKAEANEEKNYIRVVWAVASDDYAAPINQYLTFPKPDDEASVANKKKLRLKEFVQATGAMWPISSPQDLVGLTATAVIRVEDDEQYGPKNTIKRFL